MVHDSMNVLRRLWKALASPSSPNIGHAWRLLSQLKEKRASAVATLAPSSAAVQDQNGI
jgi:hypothetical protein